MGNHDWHCDRPTTIARSSRTPASRCSSARARPTASAARVGIVGLKGFVGGFPGSHLPDFGEPLLRRVYAETTGGVAASTTASSDRALPLAIVLLHYAPTGDAAGRARDDLDDARQRPPRRADRPHEPTWCSTATPTPARSGPHRDVPVYNVAVPVLGKDFWIFELSGLERATAPLH